MDFKNGDKVWINPHGRRFKGLYVGQDPVSINYHFVVSFDRARDHHSCGCVSFCVDRLVPVKTETRVKKASEIVKWLEEHGFDVDNDGVWEGPYAPHAIGPDMFQSCGLRPISDREYHPDWLEEVEI